QDEYNNEELVAEGTIEEDCDASDGEEEVEFMDVEAILEDDAHHRCECHLLNLVSTVDVDRANKTEAYKKLSRSAFFLSVTTMSPGAKSLNILQGEVNVQMGLLLQTITTLTTKLEKSIPLLRFCKPLVDALLE
ncbi:uncharacterized protein LOC125304819, partial [Scomber scombrus]